VLDGAYRVSAQAFNDLGVAGDLSWRMVYLNRSAPRAPTSVTAGRSLSPSGPVVDIRWSPNTEPDVLGYVVHRVGNPTPVCGSLATPLEASRCTDTTSPLPAGTLGYTVQAVDFTDLKQRTVPRAGTTAPTTAAATAGTAPAIPAGLVATTEDGLPKLRWSAPADPTTVSFYRIYRDGAALADRYSETVTSSPFWADGDPGTGAGVSHVYRVSAVSPGLSESALSPAVNWP
jgi:hypothetical protein